MVKVCLLGTGGMMPLPNRYLTSLLVATSGKLLLIDCGEGTQVTMKSLGWGFKAIECICFTHYHADHIAGLPGLLLTIGNSGKIDPLTLIGPAGLKKVVEGLTVISPNLPFEIKFIEILEEQEVSLQIAEFEINTLNLQHGIQCLGYSISINRRRKFNLLLAEEKKIPKKIWNRLQRGESVIAEGTLFTPDMVLGEDRKGLKICYCTDTRPIEEIIPFVKEADLFICEGMYGSDEYLIKAKEYRHMLFSEAANLSKAAKVKELWLTHYSPSLKDPENYLEVAKNIFTPTVLGEDRMTKELNFEE
ncbi:MAG: ribonuclease Z [Clostridiaceae bacterium]|nr:ribonuclease Z [Clostridiaceae bacterium]